MVNIYIASPILVAQTAKNLLAMQVLVRSLGWEDSLEKGIQYSGY